jgi:DNA polymerase-3 subunit delta'
MNLIELNNKNQTHLYGHDNIFNELSNLYLKKKLPNKIILSGPKGIGKSTLSYHLINYIFSINEKDNYDLVNFKISENNRSFNLVKNNSHPNLHLIDILVDKKNIEISQVRHMINFCNKSSFNNNEKFIIIDNVEKLNKNSLNALLKIVEEPHNNVFIILIVDSNKKILETLRSRCLKFNLFFDYKQCINVINKIANYDVSNLINSNLLHYYNSPGHYVELINFAQKNKIDLKEYDLKNFLLLLIKNSYYKKDNFINRCIYQYIEFYLLNLLNQNNSQNVYFICKKFIKKIHNMHKYNLDEESFFIEFKTSMLNG